MSVKTPNSITGFSGANLYSWLKSGTARVKCCAQEHNSTMLPSGVQTQTAWSRVQCNNHEATVQCIHVSLFPWFRYRSDSICTSSWCCEVWHLAMLEYFSKTICETINTALHVPVFQRLQAGSTDNNLLFSCRRAGKYLRALLQWLSSQGVQSTCQRSWFGKEVVGC